MSLIKDVSFVFVLIIFLSLLINNTQRKFNPNHRLNVDSACYQHITALDKFMEDPK